ncbi:MAG TPA: zinc-dependent metalloprotease [Mycobacteriales bacterium]|nr:zinc-dependent metalloprotease [Mycobacteriales bacterium]
MSPEPDPNDPLGLSRFLGADVMNQLQRLLSWSGGPVNWDLALDVARAALDRDDPEITTAQSREVAEAGRLADVWLDALTTLPAAGGEAQAWTRRAWLTTTLPAWKTLVDPVAGRVTAALGSAVEQGLSGDALPPELRGLLSGPNPFAGVMQQVGGVVFGAQVGQALGGLAADVLASSEVGIPLGPSALVPANVIAFADGLEVPLDEVRLYLALREAAHQRLFSHVPWLKAHLYDAVDAYGRGIEIDMTALEEAVGSLDLSDPSAAQEALSSGLFEIAPTPAQQAALDRLETALALVEGWVDHVVDAAADGRLPHAGPLRETVRRRRASGGPAEQTFATLVGLRLRPRRLREASVLWARITQEHGLEGRDALWAHPDLLPGTAHLDDPLSWGEPEEGAGAGDDWDAALRALDTDLDGRPDEPGPPAP